MSLFTARGQEAKENAQKKTGGVDLKKAYIKLKDGDSIRVRVLGRYDYVQYKAHGDYNLGIWTQPCVKPLGKPCAMCEAQSSGVEGYDKLYAKDRFLFVFADIDSGILRVFDATKGQANKLIADIEQYHEDLQDVAFTFKRTGEKTDTTYSLSPILRLKGDDQEKFDKAGELNVDDEYFEQLLIPRSYEDMINELKESGFPIDKHFSAEAIAKAQEVKEQKDERKTDADGADTELPAVGKEVDPDRTF